jgi:hypothetical protein
MKRQFAAPIIAKHAKAVIEAVTGNHMSGSNAVHQKLQQAAQRTEPLNGTGSPTQRLTSAQKLAAIKERNGTLKEGFEAIGWG